MLLLFVLQLGLPCFFCSRCLDSIGVGGMEALGFFTLCVFWLRLLASAFGFGIGKVIRRLYVFEKLGWEVECGGR